MQISDILRYKEQHATSEVWTITGEATVVELLAQLAEHHIGAMIVTDGDAVAGIISERDVVRRLHHDGADALQLKVADLMTTEVVHASPDEPVDRVAGLMTERRIRHLPVLQDGRLVGVVSIGDVVYSRIQELEQDRSQLEQYITG